MLPINLKSIARLLGREVSYRDAVEALHSILKAQGCSLKHVVISDNGFDISPDFIKHAKRLHDLQHQIPSLSFQLGKLFEKMLDLV